MGRHAPTGGYRRFAWTAVDPELREWFAAECAARGLDLIEDRMGNQWAWWGDPDAAPGVVTGSHLDSVPGRRRVRRPARGGERLRGDRRAAGQRVRPDPPVGVVNFGDEEGARFGIACAGSRVITGALEPDRARALTDADGITWAEAYARAGRDPAADRPRS